MTDEGRLEGGTNKLKAFAAHTWDNPAPIAGTPRQQAGFEVLDGRCPRCNEEVTVAGPGKVHCPNKACNLPLLFS